MHENHRREFMRWFEGAALMGHDFHSAVRTNAAAEQLVMSYYEKLNQSPPAPLMAVIGELEPKEVSEASQTRMRKSRRSS